MSASEVPKSRELAGRIAVVTGASSGIGQAIAVALSREHARVCALGRNTAGLADTVSATSGYSSATAFRVDLTVEGDLQALLRHLQNAGKVDILIHCAGVIRQGHMESASIDDLDLQYATNLRAPYRLTQCLLPMLIAAQGQIVFVNSSLGVAVKRPEIGQYAATRHALRAVADSLREEVNAKGVRVLSVYLGRTATPMQEAIHHVEGKAYDPALLLHPRDVASTVMHVLRLPAGAEVTDISIRPMRKR